jgi:hypothetical protein
LAPQLLKGGKHDEWKQKKVESGEKFTASPLKELFETLMMNFRLYDSREN